MINLPSNPCIRENKTGHGTRWQGQTRCGGGGVDVEGEGAGVPDSKFLILNS